MKSFTAFFSGCLFFLVGCSSATTSNAPYQTRLYVGKYDEVWTAALKAVNDYPLKLSNKDTGRMQTEVMNGPYHELFFQYPEAIELPERFRYTLKFNFAKLVSDEDEPLTRVRVVKELERFQDFYTGWLPYPSDGLEERLLLYRMEHLLRMEQKLNGE